MVIQRCRESEMYRTQCVLVLLALFAGLAHSFSWDIVVGTTTLEFYSNEGTLTYSESLTYNDIVWLAYDPVNNRVLFIDHHKQNDVYSFDMATKKTKSLVKIKLLEEDPAYDPASGLLFWTSDNSIYSFLVNSGCNNEIDGNLVIDLKKEGKPSYVAVDSCGGYIYWIRHDESNIIERVRLNGSEREVIIDKSIKTREYLTIDSQAQQMYWIEHNNSYEGFYLVSADMNGKNKRTLYIDDCLTTRDYRPNTLTVSKDFFYWLSWFEKIFWQLPKNDDVKCKKIVIGNASPSISKTSFNIIAAKYTIEEQTLGIPLCKALKYPQPNNSTTNDCDSLNVPSDVSLLCIHGTKVSGASRCECAQGYSGERCDVSVCHNYCLHGDCSASAKGQPKCRCNAGYSGERCEVDACQGYCLNNGDCSLNDESYPVCQCSGAYDGERCHFPVFLSKSYEQFKC